MSKWNKWKLIHKETGLTFKQHIQKHRLKTDTGHYYTVSNGEKLIPVLLQSGIPAIYSDMAYYPSMFFLDNKEWKIEIALAKYEL